jgi:hypothetical protein
VGGLQARETHETTSEYGGRVSVELLSARQVTHGNFADNARYAQAIKALFQSSPTWATMPDIHREAMDFIASKFARILSGQADCLQHWEDVEGYAALAKQACTR